MSEPAFWARGRKESAEEAPGRERPDTASSARELLAEMGTEIGTEMRGRRAA